MKKLVSLTLALAALLALAACTCSTPQAQESAQAVDLNAFYSTIFTDPDNTPALQDLTESPELLNGVYPGLADIGVKQMVAVTPLMAQVAADVVLVEANTPEDAQKVKTILQARIDAQKSGGAFYPALAEIWENQSEIVTRGNFVALFALEGKDAVAERFKALFD